MCCNRNCIAGGLCCRKTVLQYILGQPVSQDGRLCRDTAQVGVGQGERACWACRARATGWRAWGARAWRAAGAGARSRRTTGRAGRAGSWAVGACGRGRQASGWQAAARWARGACAAGARQARSLGAGRAAWARGLARNVHSVHPT